MKLAIISTLAPTRCGIAYHTENLLAAIESARPDIVLRRIPVVPSGPRDGASIVRDDAWSYRDALAGLAAGGCAAILLQHEFGIFGGEAGCYILHDLADAGVPVVTTFHTILRHPSGVQRSTLRAVADLSTKVIAPSALGADMLETVYGIGRERIAIIPHGAPRPDGYDRDACKRRFGVAGRTVLLSYGLLAPSKGVHHVIRALPRLVRRRPDLVYVVGGATHPRVAAEHGEAYRLSLSRLAAELGVESHLRLFPDSFEEAELGAFLAASDLFLCPYESQEQIVSGTLVTMASLGRPIAATPFWHAQTMIEAGAVAAIPFADADGIADVVLDLLAHPDRARSLAARAFEIAGSHDWAKSASSYLRVIDEAPLHPAAPSGEERLPSSPRLDLTHVHKLTTSTGMLQHCKWSIPLYREGYCTDDNARALMLCLRAVPFAGAADRPALAELVDRYLAFLLYAFNPETGRFRNFLTFAGAWTEEAGSEECHARALRALAYVADSPFAEGRDELAAELFEAAAPGAARFTSIRARAIAAIAFARSFRVRPGALARDMGQAMIGPLVAGLLARSAEWCWPEDRLTWFNAKIPHALIDHGRTFSDPAILALGLEALDWLTRQQTSSRGYFEPVGAPAPYVRGGAKPLFDQQPIEAWATVAACAAAFRATHDARWTKEANRAFDWFLGGNSNRIAVADVRTGACRDALTPFGVNRNEGAESTLAWQLAIIDKAAVEDRADGATQSLATLA